MGFERVELRCPRDLDPRPSWTLGDVLAELDVLDATRRAAPPTPLKQPPDWGNGGGTREKAFVMRVDDDDEDDTEDEDDGASHGESRALVANGARFSCNGLESSDSEDELDGQVAPYHLMEKRDLAKSILLELEREHHLKVQEEVRNKLASLEVCHQNEIQKTISAFARLQKYAESRKDIDRRLDVHFQRRMRRRRQLLGPERGCGAANPWRTRLWRLWRGSGEGRHGSGHLSPNSCQIQ